MRVGPHVERYLGLVKGNVQPGGADEFPGGVENPARPVEEVEQRRGLPGPPPGEVVAEMSLRRGTVGEQMNHLGVDPVQVGRVDQVAVLGEAMDLVAGRSVHAAVPRAVGMIHRTTVARRLRWVLAISKPAAAAFRPERFSSSAALGRHN